MQADSGPASGRSATAPERRADDGLGRRDRAISWGLFALFMLAFGGLAVLLILAVPLFVVAFPLTLSALAILLFLGWWRNRRRRRTVAAPADVWHQRAGEQGDEP